MGQDCSIITSTKYIHGFSYFHSHKSPKWAKVFRLVTVSPNSYQSESKMSANWASKIDREKANPKLRGEYGGVESWICLQVVR